jgi:transmembrane sensor
VALRVLSPYPSPPVVVERPQAPSNALRLADGSVVTPMDPASVLVVREDSPRAVAIALDRGRARFQVTPRRERDFVVNLGEVSVTVIGTVFTVERVADRIGVSVERGRVRVDWKLGEQVLQQGDSGWFPPVQIRGPAESPGARVVPPEQSSPGRRAEHVVSAPAARKSMSLANEPASAAPDPTAPKPEELLISADRARAAGRQAESARFLSRLLREHRDDPRAPLAGFTLGRIFLMELGRPREAAQAFAEVRTLAPTGPFAEDALAREAEAWQKAGDAEQATARAQEYLRIYPRGRRLRAMQGLVGGP